MAGIKRIEKKRIRIIAAVDINEFDCNYCDEGLRKMKGCVSNVKERYSFPSYFGDLFRCPKSLIINDPEIINVINIANLTGGKVSHEDIKELPNSLLDAILTVREGQEYRKEQEESKND